MPLVLETERLILRTPERRDANALARAINHPLIAATTLNIPHPYYREHAIKWIDTVRKLARENPAPSLTIFLKDTSELGLSGLNEKHRKAELGYWCAVDHWNKGITTEAAARVVRYGFQELGLARIHAICMVHNRASARVMEKLGMKFEGTARHEFLKNGRFEDFHHYAILRPDWEERASG
jgi:RimJ/RimL family protein N-acetyltransferase